MDQRPHRKVCFKIKKTHHTTESSLGAMTFVPLKIETQHFGLLLCGCVTGERKDNENRREGVDTGMDRSISTTDPLNAHLSISVGRHFVLCHRDYSHVQRFTV